MQIVFDKKDILKNIPLLVGLIGWYNVSIEGYSKKALLPYC